jgi:hypothetical protein
MKKNEVILHGECMVFPSKLPINIKRKQIKQNYVIVAPSESSGNHHIVDVFNGVDFYEDDKGTLFMKNSVETNIRCVQADRHDTITIPAGTYEFGSQQEYDPFAARMRAVAD